MSSLKYSENCRPDAEAGGQPLTIRWDWNHIRGCFEPRDKVKQTEEAVRLTQAYLDGISSNFWLKAYHTTSGKAGCLMVLLGLVLCFLVVPLVLVPLGLVALCSPRSYYAFVFKKLCGFLEAYDASHRNSLGKIGLVAYTTFSKGTRESPQTKTCSLRRSELFESKSSSCSSLLRRPSPKSTASSPTPSQSSSRRARPLRARSCTA